MICNNGMLVSAAPYTKQWSIKWLMQHRVYLQMAQK
jgi:hypothetical protein